MHQVRGNEIRFLQFHRRLIDDGIPRPSTTLWPGIKIDASIYRIRDTRAWMSKQLSSMEYREHATKLNSLIFTSWEIPIHNEHIVRHTFRAIVENNNFVINNNNRKCSFIFFLDRINFSSDFFPKILFNHRSTFNIYFIRLSEQDFSILFFWRKILSLGNSFWINKNNFTIYVSTSVFLIILEYKLKMYL